MKATLAILVLLTGIGAFRPCRAQTIGKRTVVVQFSMSTSDTARYWYEIFECEFSYKPFPGSSYGDIRGLDQKLTTIQSTRNNGILAIRSTGDSVSFQVSCEQWKYTSQYFSASQLFALRSLKIDRYEGIPLKEYLVKNYGKNIPTFRRWIKRKKVRELLIVSTGSGNSGTNVMDFTLSNGAVAKQFEFLFYQQGGRCYNGTVTNSSGYR